MKKEIQFRSPYANTLNLLLSRLSKRNKTFWHDNSYMYTFVGIKNKKFLNIIFRNLEPTVLKQRSCLILDSLMFIVEDMEIIEFEQFLNYEIDYRMIKYLNCSYYISVGSYLRITSYYYKKYALDRH